MNIDDILDEVQLPQATATISLRTDLVAEWEKLRDEFKTAPADAPSLGEVPPRTAIAQRLEALREELAKHQVTFTFEALSAPEYSKLLERHPGKKGENLNEETFIPALIARCCVDPKMTDEQAGKLIGKLSTGQVRELYAAAISVNQNVVDIPFDASVYAATLADDAS